MKTISFGVSALAVVVMVIVALLQVVNVDTRAVSLQDSLHAAMSSSLDTALNTRAYTINDEDQLVADVVQGVILELNDPKAELEIHVNKVDRVAGIVSMKVTATYHSVSGKKGVISVGRTVLLEHVNNAPAAGSHTVVFENMDGGTFKTYTLKANSQKLPYPSYPGIQGYFMGWELGEDFYPDNEAGRAAMAQLPLDKDYVFVAREEFQ